MQWTNDKICLADEGNEIVFKLKNMQNLAKSLCSHTRKLSTEKTGNVLKKFEAATPSFDDVWRISKHLLATR